MAATAPDCTPLPPWTSLFGTRLIDLLGWRLIDARPDEGWIRAGFNGKEEFCAAGGFVQGGILSAMLDATMSAGVFAMTHGKLYPPTISMTVNFLAPAKPGPITGEARVTQLGRSVAFVEGRLTADDGTLLATASTSARLVEAAKAVR
jgi:uncharacterized protein (TIGR00369 family)